MFPRVALPEIRPFRIYMLIRAREMRSLVTKILMLALASVCRGPAFAEQILTGPNFQPLLPINVPNTSP
jgi:hypothetical protein